MGTLLRYPYEVRDPKEYFDDIQDVKVTKDMLDLARHLVEQKSGHFEPDKFEDQYETALLDLINQKRAGKERPRGDNVVDLMDALRRSIGAARQRRRLPKSRPRIKESSTGPKGNADDDPGQEAGEGDGRKKGNDRAASEVCVGGAGSANQINRVDDLRERTIRTSRAVHL